MHLRFLLDMIKRFLQKGLRNAPKISSRHVDNFCGFQNLSTNDANHSKGRSMIWALKRRCPKVYLHVIKITFKPCETLTIVTLFCTKSIMNAIIQYSNPLYLLSLVTYQFILFSVWIRNINDNPP